MHFIYTRSLLSIIRSTWTNKWTHQELYKMRFVRCVALGGLTITYLKDLCAGSASASCINFATRLILGTKSISNVTNAGRAAKNPAISVCKRMEYWKMSVKRYGLMFCAPFHQLKSNYKAIDRWTLKLSKKVRINFSKEENVWYA